MLDFMQSNPEFLTWIMFFSLFIFIVSLIAMPYLIAIIPDDYFLHDKREATLFSLKHPVLRVIFKLFKNLAGIVLIILGIAMLILPGQGILTIIAGIIFVDFPNKYQLERWMVSRPRVLKTMNWFRVRMKKTPLKLN